MNFLFYRLHVQCPFQTYRKHQEVVYFSRAKASASGDPRHLSATATRQIGYQRHVQLATPDPNSPSLPPSSKLLFRTLSNRNSSTKLKMADTDGVRARLQADGRGNSPRPVHRSDPFETPHPGVTPQGSFPSSIAGSTTSLLVNSRTPYRRYFHSRRIEKGTVEKPWLNRPDPRAKWVTIIPLIGLFIGLFITGILVWDGLKSVHNFEYCPVLIEDFSNGLDQKIWTKEAEVGGYGHVCVKMLKQATADSFVATVSSRRPRRRKRTASSRTTRWSFSQRSLTRRSLRTTILSPT